MQGFKNWLNLDEALFSYYLIPLVLAEGRRKPETLRNMKPKTDQGQLFSTGDDEIEGRPEFKQCPVTPLSSYDKEISIIRNYALSNPENFAQVMMFFSLVCQC